MAECFVDTNVVIYALGEGRKPEISRQVMNTAPLISVQTLNEFLNVCRRRLKLEWDILNEATADLLSLCPIVLPLTMDTHLTARRLAQRYELATYDAVAVASALIAGCETFYSEDMHDGLVIDERLTIRNPFAGD